MKRGGGGADPACNPKVGRYAATADSGQYTAPAGTIQRIRFTNFMCHSNFDWKPETNVNFVTGVNGSGKSSILQGLTLGLLGDSKQTKRRSSKLASFIQQGCIKAVIKITLHNTGEDAFKVDVYGDKITIQTSITMSNRALMLLDSRDQVIIRSSSKARQEGKRLLEQFRLVTDNPTVILHQEEAKELLNVQSPEKLFQFVQEATSLKPCKDLLERAEFEINKTKERLGARKENLRGLRATMNVKEEELKTINGKIEKSENENTLGKELISVLLNDSRKAQKKIVESLHDKRKLKDEHEVQIESLEKDRNNLDVQIEGIRAKLKEENIKVKQDLSDLRKENKRLTDEKKNDERCIKETDSHIKRINEELKIQEDIRKDAEKKRTLHKDISVKKDQEKEIKLKIANFEDEKMISEKTLEVNDQRIKAAKYSKINCQTKLDGLRRELKKMEVTASFSLATIDALAPQVMKEIDKVVLRFVEKPVGPVGSLISLSNEAQIDRNLVRLIESEIGVKLLKSYVVNDDTDRRLLKEIFDKVYGRSEKPVIFQSKFLKKRHNVLKVEHQKTILDYIKFSGSEQEAIVVFNHLVDQKSIESIVITEKQSEAKKLCTYRHQVPENLKHVITLDNYKFIPPSDRSSYRSYYLEPQPARVLDRKINCQIDEQKIAIAKAEDESKRLEEEVNTIQGSSLEEKGKFEKALKNIIALTKRFSKINIALNQLIEENKNAEEPEDLEKKKNDLVSLKNSLGLSKEKLKNTNLNIEINKANMKSVQNESLKVRDVSMQLETELNNKESLVISNRKDVCNKMKVVKRCQDEISQLEANLRKETKRMEERKKKALNLNVDPDPSADVSSRTAEQISACIEQVRKATDGFESSVARKQQAEILKTLNILKESVRCEKEKINEIAKFVRDLEEMNVERKERYFLIRDLIKNQIERTFSVLIQDLSDEINTRILLRINYKNREVNFEEEGENYSQFDLSCLSGGEKTFLQMCLIAALWKHSNPPFRALDEWDVFLDPINRKKVSKKLLEIGLSHPENQFLFISPQGSADLEAEVMNKPNVKVLEVKK